MDARSEQTPAVPVKRTAEQAKIAVHDLNLPANTRVDKLSVLHAFNFFHHHPNEQQIDAKERQSIQTLQEKEDYARVGSRLVPTIGVEIETP